MAKLTGPLFSLGAAGTIAKTLTYAAWKGVPYVRTRVIPANPNTLAQQQVRGVFSTLTEMWKRMPNEARLPFIHRVRGQPLTARNAHLQANVAELIDDVNMDDLVMSIAGGSAIVPITVTAVDGTNGHVSCSAEAPAAPAGYTFGYMSGVACQDGDPSPVIVRQTFAADDPTAPYAWDIVCGIDGDYQVGIFGVWIRDSDSKAFCSAAVRSQVTVSGS